MLFGVWDRFWSLSHVFLRSVDRLNLDRQEWILVGVGILLLGLVCLRGFGSRANY
jgi:hypothetical protein